ncbi:MAG: hypothetical protein ACRDWA_05420 [Acidimicrobiia bacterium]
MQTDRRRLDQIQDPDFIADLDSLTLDELRARRDLAEDVENELSYYRRFLHGRLDLLAFEQRRRRGEETRSLIDALTEILTGRDHTGAASSRHLSTDVPDIPLQGRRHLDHVLGNDLMARLGEMSEEELSAAASELSDLESEISTVRQGVQAIVDRVHAQVISRYKHDLGDPALRPS